MRAGKKIGGHKGVLLFHLEIYRGSLQMYRAALDVFPHVIYAEVCVAVCIYSINIWRKRPGCQRLTMQNKNSIRTLRKMFRHYILSLLVGNCSL